MKPLLDTNVWIAGLISRGMCAELIDYCIGEHRLPISDWISREATGKPASRFGYSSARLREVEAWLREVGEYFVLQGEPPSVCRDPDDDYVLHSACRAEADCLVTGDQDLLVLGRYEGIVIAASGGGNEDHRRVDHVDP